MRGVIWAGYGLRWGRLLFLVVLAAGIPAARARPVQAQSGTDYQVTCRFDPPVLAENQPATLRVVIEDLPYNVNAFDIKMMSRPNGSVDFIGDDARIGDFFGEDAYSDPITMNILGPSPEMENVEAVPAGALRVSAVMMGAATGSGELFSADFFPMVSGKTDFKFNEAYLTLASDSKPFAAPVVDCTTTVYRAYYLPMVNPDQGNPGAGG